MKSETSIAFVILNWNCLDDTVRCLESLGRLDPKCAKLDVLVVDNGSNVDPTNAINSKFPHVQAIRLTQNQGFAGGSNKGIASARACNPDFVCLLNNDTIVEPDFLQPILDSFQKNKKLALISPVIQTDDRPNEIEFAGGRISYALGRFDADHLEPRQNEHIRFCDYASGCCMFIDRRVLAEVGLLDEVFFAYFEDTDFSIRVRSRGYDVGCCLDSSIRHKGSASTRTELREGTTSPFKHYLVARNRLLLIRKHAPTLARLFFLTVIQPLSILYYLTGFLLRNRPTKARAFLLGVWDGLRRAPVRQGIDKWL